MFSSASELDSELEKHTSMVNSCALGSLPFSAFLASYGSFFWRAALDGHESDEEEKALLASREQAISLHREVADQVLGLLCAEEDAQKPAYVAAGRIGSSVALQRLRQLAVKHSLRDKQKQQDA